MSLIGDILPIEHIVLDLDVGSKKRIFEQVGLLLENQKNLARADVFDCLFAREKLGTTGLGQGVAIPHGRYPGLKTAVGVFIRVKEPVLFDAPDGKPVSLVFALLVPEQANSVHLEVLSLLATKFSNKAVREQLLASEDAHQVRQLLVAD